MTSNPDYDTDLVQWEVLGRILGAAYASHKDGLKFLCEGFYRGMTNETAGRRALGPVKPGETVGIIWGGSPCKLIGTDGLLHDVFPHNITPDMIDSTGRLIVKEAKEDEYVD